jgi:hemoglobin-like flavoprotein
MNRFVQPSTPAPHRSGLEARRMPSSDLVRQGGAGSGASPSGAVRRPDAGVMAMIRPTRLAVADRPVELAVAFYEQLFVLAPGAREMFPPDLGSQEQAMTAALMRAVGTLDAMAALEAELRRLGWWHATFHGVGPEHYPYVGQALVRAVRQLSPGWDEGALGSAWLAVMKWITAQMLAGADEATPAVGGHDSRHAAGAGYRPGMRR